MRKLIVGMTLAAASLSLVVPSMAEMASMQASTLVIGSMTAESAQKVQKKLEAVPGVTQVKVSQEKGLAVVVYDPTKVKTEEFTRAMQSAGVLATFAKANFRCPACPATYADAGTCIVDGSTLESVA